MGVTSSDRIRLVVLFGGQSPEHDVSCVSARHLIAAVDPDRYRVEPIGITRDGQWVRAEADAARLASGAELPAALTPAGPPVNAIELLADADPETTVVVPVLHGPRGEDGTLQGLLELLNLPYVGAGVLASALCMDKVACKDHLRAHHLPQCRYRSLTAHDRQYRRADGTPITAEEEATQAIAELGLPLFIKPANMGSSIGVSRATDHGSVVAAIEQAARFDRLIVIEEAVTGREIEVAVLGNEQPAASVAGEIISGAEFYDYDDKYDDGAELIIPVPLSDEQLADVQTLAVAAFQACRVEGLARVDFFYEPSETGGRGWLINEINTMPGFTPISMYPKLWQASGVGYADLIDRLIGLAFDRNRRDRTVRRSAR